MKYEYRMLPLFLASVPLPDANQVFDKVWGISPLGAVFGLFALIAVAATVFQFLELRTERKEHRKDCATKDAALAHVNEQVQVLLTNATTATLGLINKLELMQAKSDTTELREDVDELARSLKNGLRALGQKLDVPPERMNMD